MQELIVIDDLLSALVGVEGSKLDCRNIFSDDGITTLDETDLKKEMARYVRGEVGSLSLTDKKSIFSGNFSFIPLENKALVT
ncbi:hypothetical protein EUTSA_v10029279mg [Eutrema salsugineum]|uniref:Uncharacterized protein n=1 Tax=Eutrema salsugineum TaxID=72664 RepID=V4N0E5_EUTSA|nr:hypothetical protein EUTSA_v10029279mg [Eutrema salsugineum]